MGAESEPLLYGCQDHLRAEQEPHLLRSNLIRQLLILCLLPVLPALVGGLAHPKRPSLQPETLREGEVLSATAMQWGDEALWVDARSLEDFGKGHVPNAVLLNEDDWDMLLEEFLNVWEPGRAIIVYCDSRECHASDNVARLLREEVGLERVYVLKGGWEAWLRVEARTGVEVGRDAERAFNTQGQGLDLLGWRDEAQDELRSGEVMEAPKLSRGPATRFAGNIQHPTSNIQHPSEERDRDESWLNRETGPLSNAGIGNPESVRSGASPQPNFVRPESRIQSPRQDSRITHYASRPNEVRLTRSFASHASRITHPASRPPGHQ